MNTQMSTAFGRQERNFKLPKEIYNAVIKIIYEECILQENANIIFRS